MSILVQSIRLCKRNQKISKVHSEWRSHYLVFANYQAIYVLGQYLASMGLGARPGITSPGQTKKVRLHVELKTSKMKAPLNLPPT